MDYTKTAQRPSWQQLPAAVHATITSRLAAPIASVELAGSGFTTGFAGVITTVAHERIFIKAISNQASPSGFYAYELQAQITPQLPPEVPTPKLRWVDYVNSDWIVLGFDAVTGRLPGQPWTMADLTAVGQIVAAMAKACTNPPTKLVQLTLTEDLGTDGQVWQNAANGTWPLVNLPAWQHEHLQELAELESVYPIATAGNNLLHVDLRPDNLLVDTSTSHGGWVCDWVSVTIGAGWVDLITVLPSAHAAGLDVDGFLATHPLTHNVPATAINSFLAAFGGYYVRSHRLPPPPGVSASLRTHQRYYAEVSMNWLKARMGW